nr:hypothetical protein [uncultured Bdellovibrio sp.]
MIEIVVGIWAVCLVLSLMVSGFNIYMVRRRLNSVKLKTLNANLEKLNLYWSYTNSNFQPLSPDIVAHDKNRSLRQAYAITLLGLLSIPGLLILMAVVLSIHFLAKTRKEMAVMGSDLAKVDSLSQEQVSSLVQELDAIV